MKRLPIMLLFLAITFQISAAHNIQLSPSVPKSIWNAKGQDGLIQRKTPGAFVAIHLKQSHLFLSDRFHQTYKEIGISQEQAGPQVLAHQNSIVDDMKNRFDLLKSVDRSLKTQEIPGRFIIQYLYKVIFHRNIRPVSVPNNIYSKDPFFSHQNLLKASFYKNTLRSNYDSIN